MQTLHAAVFHCQPLILSCPVIRSAHDCVIPAHGKGVVKTGLSIAIPAGTYARVAPRSGLAVKHFIDTGAGVVDEDYRGEVGVVLFNHGQADFQGVRSCLLSGAWRCCGMLAARMRGVLRACCCRQAVVLPVNIVMMYSGPPSMTRVHPLGPVSRHA